MAMIELSSFWKGIMRASISHCSTAIMKPRWAGLARPPALQEQFAHLKVLCPRRFLPHWLHFDSLPHRMPLTVSPQRLADRYNFPSHDSSLLSALRSPSGDNLIWLRLGFQSVSSCSDDNRWLLTAHHSIFLFQRQVVNVREKGFYVKRPK